MSSGIKFSRDNSSFTDTENKTDSNVLYIYDNHNFLYERTQISINPNTDEEVYNRFTQKKGLVAVDATKRGSATLRIIEGDEDIIGDSIELSGTMENPTGAEFNGFVMSYSGKFKEERPQPAPKSTPVSITEKSNRNTYENQLQELSNMGFNDIQGNTILLEAFNGDVERVVEALLQ